MVCKSCGEKPENTAKDFTKAVVEINNPDKLVLFRKVVVPVSMGTEEDFPASVGKYYNVLLQYEANGDMYLYSSDGIPTKLSSDVSELQHELDQLGIKVDGEILARIAADSALEDSITALDDSLSTVAKTGNYNDLTNKPTIVNATITIKRNNANVGTFTANATANKSIDISVPTKTSDIANDGSDGSSTYVENDELSAVATSGSYNDLLNKPTIGNATLTIKKNNANVGTFTANATSNKSINITVPTKTSELTNNGSDNTSVYVEADELATVATTGNYNDLTNKPTIGNATLTIKRNSTQLGTFKANATSGTTVDISVPTKTSDLANDGADGTSTFVETDDLPVVDTAYSASSNNAIANSTVTNSLNRDVMTNLTLDTSPSTTTVNLNNTKTNLASPSSTTTTAITLPVASSTQAGVMNSSTFDAVTNNTNNINALLSGAVAVTGLPASPTQAQITSAWESETGLSSLINRASVYDVTNNKVWTYYTNDTTWHAASNTSQVTVNTFTNSSEGVIKGSTNTGQVFAENDGTGSVNGWDTLTGTVANHTSKLATIEQGAEVNVQSNWTQTNTTADDYIKNKPANLVQDASYVHTDNNFTTTLKNKLNGIESGAEVNVQADWSQSNTSADDYIKNKPTIPTVNNATLTIQKNGTNVQTFTANSSTNKTANITVPTAVSELTNDANYATTTQLNDGLATKQNTLTAGSNITITGNTISATDTTYTAGNAIDITNNVISADVYPADFFTSTTETVTAEGTDITLANTSIAPFVSITPKGDTFQQTYTGKNILNNEVQSQTISGVTVTRNTDGTLSFSGTSTAVVWLAVAEHLTIDDQCYLSGCPDGGSVTTYSLQTSTYGGTLKADYGSGVILPAGSFKLWLVIRSGVNASGLVFKPQIELGSTATEYEPYVGGIASPNPDYPQNVKVVTGEQTVKVTGKNMLDETTMEQGGFNFRTGADYSLNSQIRSKTIKCLPSTTYVISDKESLGEFAVVYGSQTGAVIEGSNKSTTAKFWSFTTPANAYSMRIRIGSNDYPKNTSGSYDIQLELGSTATTYEPYQSQNYELNLGKNLLKIESSQQGGVAVTLNADGSITCVGTTGNNPYYNFMPYQQALPQMLPAGTYTFSRSGNSSQTRIRLWDSSKTNYAEFYISPSATYATVTTTFDCYYVNGYVSGLSANTQINETLKLQLEAGSTPTTFARYKTPLELCKIGDYQDYIYKSGDNWYVHKDIGYMSINVSNLSSFNNHSGSHVTVNYDSPMLKRLSSATEISVKSANYVGASNQQTWGGSVLNSVSQGHNGNYLQFALPNSAGTSYAEVYSYFQNHPTSVYFALATPTDTQITDSTLIAQLEALANANSYVGVTHMTVTSDGYNLPFILTAEAFANTLVGMTEVIDSKQRKLTAGENIAIDANNVISATDTTYTAGNAIDIDGNNVISADVYPADFFTNTTETTSDTGTDIALTNAAFAPLASVTPKGDTSQQTYTGKNLLKLEAPTTSQAAGLTITPNATTGTITFSGTNTGTYPWLNGLVNTTLPAGTYTFSINTALPYNLSVRFYNENSQFPTSATITAGQTKATATTTYAIAKLGVVYSVSTTGVTIPSTTIYPQLEAGSTATAFEPYVGGTASPNPDYPQDVKAVTGEQTVVVTGKNLANYVPKTSPDHGLSSTYDSTTGEIHITGTASTGWSDISQTVQEMMPAGTYTFSVINVSGNFDKYVALQTVGGSSYNCNVGSTRTFTKTADSSQIRFWLSTASGKVYDATIKLQLELGSTATDYEPYQSQEYKLNLGGNLFDQDSTHLAGYLDESGEPTSSDYSVYYADYIPVSGNSIYTLSYTVVTYGTSVRYVAFYDTNKSFISRTSFEATSNATITTPSNAKFIRISFRNQSGVSASAFVGTYLRNIQLEAGTKATPYTPYTPYAKIELCKIGDYQDYFYKDGGNWYLHKEVKKITLDGSENWSSRTNSAGTLQMDVVATTSTPISLTAASQYCNYARYRASAWNFGEAGEFAILDNTRHLLVGVPSTTTIEAWKAKIGANNLIAYFVLATPTNTQITNTALIEQLGALGNANSYRDITHATTASDGYNLPVILTAEAFTNSLAGISKAIDGKQNKLTAGENITIDANNVISATATGNSTITMTDTDPGEGQPLAADNYIAVYGGSGRGGFSRYTANQSIPGSTATTLLPNTTQTPDDGISYANGVAVIQKAGWWILTATVGGTQTAAGYLTVEIAVNNVVVSSASGATTANFTHCRNVIWAGKLSVVDTVKVQVSTQFAMNINKRERGAFCGVLVSED